LENKIQFIRTEFWVKNDFVKLLLSVMILNELEYCYHFLKRIFLMTTFLCYLSSNEANCKTPIDLSNWIVSPNGGESFAIGSTINISINGAIYNPSTIVVELYQGSTRVWGPSYAGLNNRTISTSGLSGGANFRVRIYNASNALEEDYSNGFFSITDNVTNWIISPNGGESYASGTSIPVSLSSYGNSLAVQLSLYKGTTLISGPNTGGNSNRTISLSGAVAGNDYRIKVNNASNPSEEDWSNGYFSITGSSGGGNSCPSPVIYGQIGCISGTQLTMTATSSAAEIPNICSSTVTHKWYTSETGNITVSSTIESAGTCAVYKTRINVVTPTSYWVSAVINGCESPRVQVTSSYQNIEAPTLVTGASICGSGSATISANPGLGGNSIKWYTSNNSNEVPLYTGSSYTTPVLSSSTTYYVSSYNTTTGCTSTAQRVPVVVSVNPIPSIPISSDNYVCGSGSVVLTAQPGINGNTVRWYSYSPINLITTGATFTTPPLTISSNLYSYYVSTYNNVTLCESTKQIINARLRSKPPTPSVYGQIGCLVGESLYMSATSTASEIPDICTTIVSHNWYTSATGSITVPSTFESASTCAVYKTRINVTNETDYWVATVVNGCESDRVKVSATYQTVGVPTSVTGTSICGPGTATISAEPGINGNSIRWFTTIGNENELGFAIGSTFSTSSIINQTTTYYASSYNTTTGCESKTPRIPVTIVVNPTVDPPIAQDNFTCGSGIVALSAKPGSNGSTVKWFSSNDVLLNTGLSFNTPNLNIGDNPITYIVKSYDEVTNCESIGIPITASVKTLQSCMNFVSVIAPQGKFINETTNFFDLPPDQVLINTSYYDGLGRIMQIVNKKSSFGRNDIVTINKYDEFGREKVKYLPFISTLNDGLFKLNDLELQNEFYELPPPAVTADESPFSITTFENSPLNRPLLEIGPGKLWKDNNKGIAYEYLVNIDGTAAGQERVIAWDVHEGVPTKSNMVNSSVTNGYYLSGQLMIKSTKDEHGIEVREYVDKDGRMILKKVQIFTGAAQINIDSHWAQTYYIYDDLGNLIMVLPPEAVKALTN
jgi:hypothetical protein